MSSQTKPFLSRIRRYFHAYGGWGTVFRSPLFLLSLTLSLISYRNWINDHWSNLAQSILPNLLGFSLGTYALLFSLMTSRLKRALKAVKNDRDVTYLDEINATFFHFIFIQVIAIIWSFAYQGTLLYDIFRWLANGSASVMMRFFILQCLGGIIGMTLLLYSITLVVGSALAIYRLALIVDPAAD